MSNNYRFAHPPLLRILVCGILLLQLCLLTTQAALAQDTSASAQHEETLRGTVVNGLTHQPIGHALVYSMDNRLGTFTDSEGHFAFKAPAPGERLQTNGFVSSGFSVQMSFSSSWLKARKPGFIEPTGNDNINWGPGADVVLTLLPEAIIHGRVMISRSESATGISVQLFRRQVEDGSPRWRPSSMTRTNSAGEFRFAELSPGSYKIMTHELLDTDPQDMVPRGQVYGYPPRCFPGVPDFSSGETIRLTAGQDFEANIPLSRHPYRRVSMPVMNAEATALNITVSLEGRRGPGYSLGYNAGRHAVEGLLPDGSYLVEANGYGQPPSSGSAILNVYGRDAQGPAVVLAPAIRIPVNVSENFASEWNGSSIVSNGTHTFQLQGPRSYLWVQLQPVSDFGQQASAGLAPPHSAADEPLAMENVLPGRYWLRIHTAHGYVQSVTSGGVDLLREPLVVMAGSHSPIEISMRDDGAKLEGTVTGLKADAPGGTQSNMLSMSSSVRAQWSNPAAYIYCIPEPGSRGQFLEFPAWQDGTFSSPALPLIAPGAYLVLAFAQRQPDLPYRDHEAMKAYELQGQVIRLSAGETQRLQLQLASGESK